MAESGRNPYDGKPYYCAVCGCGLAEFVNCELPECELERPHEAEARRREQLLRESAASGEAACEAGRAH